MAEITWADVVAVAPELSTVASDAQDMIIAYVNDDVSPAAFGGETSPKLKLARVYLAAHEGTLASQSGAGPAGPVTSETDGTIARSYAAGSTDNASHWNSTSYGRSYVALVRTSRARLPRPRFCL